MDVGVTIGAAAVGVGKVTVLVAVGCTPGPDWVGALVGGTDVVGMTGTTAVAVGRVTTVVGWASVGAGLAVAAGDEDEVPFPNWIAPMSKAGPRCLAKKSSLTPMSAAAPAAGEESEG